MEKELNAEANAQTEKERKYTSIINEEIFEKLKALAYYDRSEIKIVMREAFEDYLNKRGSNVIEQALKLYKERPLAFAFTNKNSMPK